MPTKTSAHLARVKAKTFPRTGKMPFNGLIFTAQRAVIP